MAEHEHDTDPELEGIRQQMDETRSSLAEKLDALENKVLTPVQDATAAVANTVEDVKEVVESVTESVQDTVESVKETFNVSERVRDNPWLMLGGAVTAGFIGGWLLGPRRQEYTPPTINYQPQPAVESSRSEEDEDSEGFAPFRMLKGLAIGTLMGVMREMLTDALPANLTSNVKTMVDDFTTKLGGSPINSSGNGNQATSPVEEEHNGRHAAATAAQPESPPQPERPERSDRRRAGARGS